MENWTKGRGKETEWKHIENKSGKPWRISTETWKTGRKEGEKKQNGNTLRTRAGNRGGLVLRRGKLDERKGKRNRMETH